ncbi:hypothetical protein ACFL3V_02730 [Nanoarchaeota archaeon]
MVDIGKVFNNIGNSIKAKLPANLRAKVAPVRPGAAVPSAKALPGKAGAPATGVPVVTPPGVKKAFDIKLYFKAVGLFFNDFFKKKLPYFFKNMGPVLKQAVPWWNKLPNDEKASYGVLALGHVLIITGIVLFIVL